MFSVPLILNSIVLACSAFLGSIAGIWFKGKLDKQSEIRHLYAKDAEYLCEEVRVIREKSIYYWSSNFQPEDIEGQMIYAEIIGRLHGMSIMSILTHEPIKKSQKKGASHKTLKDAIKDFREVCTGKVHSEKDPYNQNLVAIEQESHALIAKILTFRRQ